MYSGFAFAELQDPNSANPLNLRTNKEMCRFAIRERVKMKIIGKAVSERIKKLRINDLQTKKKIVGAHLSLNQSEKLQLFKAKFLNKL